MVCIGLPEIVVHDILRLHAQRIEIVGHGLDQHWRTAKVVLAVFRCIVILEIGVADAVHRKAGIVLHTGCVGLGIRTVEREMEVEIGEFLFQLPEVLQEEGLCQRAGTIEEMHLTVSAVQRLGHVHDLRTKRSHTGTTTNPNHLFASIKARMEVTIRTTHHHLVTGLEAEDVRRPDTCRHILEAHLWSWQERRGSDTHSQRNDVALSGIVGHRISTHGRLRVMSFQREDIEFFPSSDIFVSNHALVEVLVIVDAIVSRNLDLSIRTRNEVHVLTRWQCHLELLDKAGNVFVGDDGALPLLHAKDGLRNLNVEVAFDLCLASQTPMLFDLLTCEVRAL